MFKKLFVVLGLAVGTTLAFACSSTADAECVAGRACSCADCNKTCGGNGKECSFACTGGTCNFTCTGGGCQAEAKSASAVTLDCPGGGCSLTATGTTSSTLACAGDRCQHTCSGAQSCKTTQCKSGCQTSCNGAATCESSCSATSGGCQVDGQSQTGAAPTPTGGETPSPVPPLPGTGD